MAALSPGAIYYGVHTSRVQEFHELPNESSEAVAAQRRVGLAAQPVCESVIITKNPAGQLADFSSGWLPMSGTQFIHHSISDIHRSISDIHRLLSEGGRSSA
jgi:hypothetical protein